MTKTSSMVRNYKNNKEALSDKWLVESYITSQDVFYIGELFSRYLHLVYGVCLKWTNERQVAQDACVGVLECVLKWVNYTEQENFKYWLHGLTNRYCEFFMQKKDDIGFLKEDVSDASLLEFVIEEPLNYSERSMWQLYTKGKVDLESTMDEKSIELLNRFFLNEETIEEISRSEGMSHEKLWVLIKNEIKHLKEAFPEDSIALLKSRSHKEKPKTWDAYLKYFTNEIHGKEKNAFERELIADSFDFEAYDGLRLFAGVSIGADLDAIQRRIHRRTGYEKVLRKSSLNYKAMFSVLGAGVFLVLVLLFAIKQLSFDGSNEEDIPRRIIESTLYNNEEGSAALFESEQRDSTEKQNVLQDTVVVPNIPARRPTRKIDSILPLPALSLNQIGLEARSASPQLIDVELVNNASVVKSDVIFVPEEGLDAFKQRVQKELQQAELYPVEGFKVDVILKSNGAIKDVNVVDNTDINLHKKVKELIERDSVWELLEGTVEEKKEYLQQIVF